MRCAYCRWAAYPPKPEKLDELFELGFKDTLNWLIENNKLSEQLVPNGSPNGHAVANGHAAQAVSDAESEESMDEEKPLWRQLVAQTACAAPSCDESLKEAVAGKPDVAHLDDMSTH